jgi:tetratricopeptide (TPR) repeat protein
MSLFLPLGILCVVGGAALCGVLFVQKYATLRVLDPASSRATREKKLRNRIMEDRMQRTLQSHVHRIRYVSLVPWHVIQDAFRRIAGKLVAIERRYHRERARDVRISVDELQSMLLDAERALRDERFQVAEERLVELISVAPKFAQAYEVLSRVYAAKKEWKEAIESLMCYVKLVPQDAEGYFLLASLYEEAHEEEKAFVEYALALEKSPHNPKYLDAHISCALVLKKYSQAAETLKTLVEVNPDNAKIETFTEALASHKKTS